MRPQAEESPNGGGAVDAEIDLLLACVQPGAGCEDSQIERLLQRDLNWEWLTSRFTATGTAPSSEVVGQ
jgi:hypothetical protein